MKKILFTLYLLFCAAGLLTAQRATILDVLTNDTLSYFEKIGLIEADSMEIYNNSDSSQQKRYMRMCAFYNYRIETNGNIPDYFDSINSYLDNRNLESIGNNPLDLVWEHLGPFESANLVRNIGQARSIAVDPYDPNIVYVGSATGGVFKTINADANPIDVKWTCVSDGYFCFGVQRIVVHPGNPDIVFALTGVDMSGIIEDVDGYSIGIYKSTDAGASWVEVLGFEPEDVKYITDMAINTINNNMFVVGKKFLYKSTDGGNNWTIVSDLTNHLQTNPGQDLFYIEINKNNQNLMYASGRNAFYFSTNGGVDWDLDNSLYDSNNNNALIKIDCYSNTVYALIHEYNQNGNTISNKLKHFDYSIPAWATDHSNVPDVAGHIMQMKISPNGVVYAGGLWLNRFIGSGWESQVHTYHMDCRDVAFSNTTNGFPAFIATDGGVVKNTSTADNGWGSINGDLSINQYYSFSEAETNPEIMIGGGPDCGTQLRKADGSWKSLPVGGDGGATVIDYSAEDFMIGVEGYDIRTVKKSNNGGISFTPAGLTVPKYDSPIMQHPTEPTKFFAGAWHDELSNNNCSTWNHYSSDWQSAPGGLVIAMAMSPVSSNPPSTDKFYFSRYNLTLGQTTMSGFYKLTNNGGSANDLWPALNSALEPPNTYNLHDYPIVDIECHPTDENKLWVVLSRFCPGNKVFYSINSGSTWTNISYNLPNIPINCIVYDPKLNGCFLGSDFGLWYKEEQSNQWQKFYYNGTSDLPEVLINDIDIVKSTGDLVIGTFGRGAWRTPIHCGITEADIIIDSNTTWGFPQGINSNVIVESGFTLTI
ncbi:MAG: hypothetical protein K9H64_18510, partial [Bacteroidales bacterium]|nr:hypothetical protein [Bacteroidales bacterium]MCF8458057.1 hypothetical protein [Bacteroidales bacterium]